MTGPERHYTGAAGREYHGRKHILPAEAVSWVARLRAEKIQPFVQPTDMVFEFGAGTGWNLLGLRCARRIAFDLSGRPESSDPGIDWIDNLSEIAPESINVVVCHHTLEHVELPPVELRKLAQLLRPGERILLFVPFEKERRYRQHDPNEPNHHLYSWNAQTLGNLVTECGFKLESATVGEFGYDRFASNLAYKLKIGERGFRLIRRMVHLVKPASEVRVVASRR